MDPNANLEELRRLAYAAVELSEDADAVRLAELVLALDSWLLKGGAFPKAWTAPRGAHPKGMNWLRR